MNTSTRSAETLKTLCLGLSYVFSYAYISLFASSYQALGITIFLTLLSLGAILWLELSIRQQTLLGRFSPSKIQKVETRFWEVILILLSISTYRGGQVVALSFFFVHAVVIYMVLVGTGHLLSDRSSCLMPMDLLNGGFRLTFGNIILRIVSLFNLITHRYEMPAEASPAYAEALSSATSPDSSDSAVPASYPYPVTNPERKNPGRVLAILGVLFLIFLFFVAAVNNLARVDGHFNDALLSIDKFFTNISVSTTLLKFFFSIPVGAFLFGLFQGCVEKDIQKEKDFREKIVSSSGKFRFMPDTLFCVVLSVFIAVYLAFYVSQASYMFSAFAGVLPEKFTASEYAVSGFHELINVVLINFILLLFEISYYYYIY